MIVAGIELGLPLVRLLSDRATQALLLDWLAATPSNVFEHGRGYGPW